MRLTKLKRKILLVLLHSRRTPSVEELAARVYPEKDSPSRPNKTGGKGPKRNPGEGPEAARIYQMLFIDHMNRRKSDEWMPNEATTAVRRALESMRQEELIAKDEFWEERDEFHRYGRWRPSLTERGEKLAREVRREVLEYFEEWAHLVCDVHEARGWRKPEGTRQ